MLGKLASGLFSPLNSQQPRTRIQEKVDKDFSPAVSNLAAVRTMKKNQEKNDNVRDNLYPHSFASNYLLIAISWRTVSAFPAVLPLEQIRVYPAGRKIRT